jgi:hypothetical protein
MDCGFVECLLAAYSLFVSLLFLIPQKNSSLTSRHVTTPDSLVRNRRNKVNAARVFTSAQINCEHFQLTVSDSQSIIILTVNLLKTCSSTGKHACRLSTPFPEHAYRAPIPSHQPLFCISKRCGFTVTPKKCVFESIVVLQESRLRYQP